MKRSRMILDGAIVGTLLVAVLGATMALSSTRRDLEFFDPIIDIKHLLDTRYVEEFDAETLQEGAIEGMLETLDDPYTVYVPGRAREDFQKDLTGEYVGIGAQITIDEGWLEIVSPLEDSPAYRSGIMAGDRIVAIEGTSTLNKTVDESAGLLMGDPGTPVTITIERDARRFDLTILRDHIKTRSVKGFHRDPDDPEEWQFVIDPQRRVAFVRIIQFTPAVADELARSLERARLEHGPLGGLILDFRDNPGGVLDEAIQIADLFLGSGVIVSTNGRAHDEFVARASSPGTLPDFPIVVMINGSSASASEVVAGALVENDRAIALGTRSFGKGSVQGVIPLSSSPDGAEFKMTEQYYYLPSGRLLHRRPDSAVWGVDPTEGFYVPLTFEEERDMFIARQQQDIIDASGDADDENWSDPEWILEALKDKQLAAAVRALQQRIDTGDWVSTGREGKSGEALAAEELASLSLTRERLLRELQRIDRRTESLRLAAADQAEDDPYDLWPDDLDLEGGTLIVRDAQGQPVRTMRITGNRLERWLIDADLEPLDDATGDDAETAPPDEPEASPTPAGGN